MEKTESLLLGLDAGNSMAKTVGKYGEDIYNTHICDWFDRSIVETFGDDDMEFKIGDRKGFAGTIARYEDEYGGSMHGNSKAHGDTKIRVLLSIFRYIEKYSPSTNTVSIVVGQPVSTHNEREKAIIKRMLEGTHSVTVNGKTKTILIERVEVAVEGGAAYWYNPTDDRYRVLDVGSGTVNAITIFQKNIINNASRTFNFGVDTVRDKQNLHGIAQGVIRNTTSLKWDRGDDVFLCGGVAEEIGRHIAEYYENLVILRPEVVLNGEKVVLEPVYANAIGYYELAKKVF